MWHSIRSPDMSCPRTRSSSEDAGSFRIDWVDVPTWRGTHPEHSWAKEFPSVFGGLSPTWWGTKWGTKSHVAQPISAKPDSAKAA